MKYKNILLKILSILLILIFWQFYILISNNQFIPRPKKVITGFYELSIEGDDQGNTLFTHLRYSLVRVLFGFVFAATLALSFAILSFFSKSFQVICTQIVEILRPIPPIAWIPIIILIFGTDLFAVSLIVFIGAFFPIWINTQVGFLDTKKVYMENAQVHGASKVQTLKKVVLPGAAPSIITGLRIGFSVAWMTIVAAELMSTVSLGLGYEITYMQQLGHYWGIVDCMIMIGIVGYLFNKLFLKLEDLLCAWKKGIVYS